MHKKFEEFRGLNEHKIKFWIPKIVLWICWIIIHALIDIDPCLFRVKKIILLAKIDKTAQWPLSMGKTTLFWSLISHENDKTATQTKK